MRWFPADKLRVPAAEAALPGRSARMRVPPKHEVSGHPLAPPFPPGLRTGLFGLGCFWGAERKFWQVPGVWTTAVGYAGGHTPNPTYEEVCSGQTGHAEVVLVVFDPELVPFERLLAVFWESHDPTQGMRQGNDVGTQYRSAIYPVGPEQLAAARASACSTAPRWRRPATARSPPRSRPAASSSTPSRRTSSTWPRTRVATAAWAAPAWCARLGSAPSPARPDRAGGGDGHGPSTAAWAGPVNRRVGSRASRRARKRGSSGQAARTSSTPWRSSLPQCGRACRPASSRQKPAK